MQVLHLEDLDHDAELVAIKLSRAWPTCQIHRVASGEEYQTALLSDHFDLILSDYTLQNYDGLTALQLARARCPTKPFIFFSGTIGEDRAIEALKAGASDYVCKDRPARLLPAIESALARTEAAQSHTRKEELLRQNREQFQHIAENITDLIATFDPGGQCLYCNPSWCATVGRQIGDFSHTAFTDVHPGDSRAVHEIFLRTSQSGVGGRLEQRLVHRDGAVHCVEAHYSVVRNDVGSVVQVLMVARDITVRRAAEERIREQAALLDHAQDAILVRDLDNHITYWNRSATRVYGWTPQETPGQPASALWSEDPVQIEEARCATLTHGEWSGEIRQRPRGGDELLLQSRWTLVRKPDGTAAGFLIINTDITDQKRFEAQFLRVQRTESIGLLAGGFAHDINNSLAPILLSIELLGSFVTNREALAILATIRTSAQHGAALVQQLLSFTRGVVGQKTVLAPGPLLEDFVGFLRQTFPHEITIELTLTPGAWPVRGDATQLKQVLMNLCLNARDALRAQGRIAITLENTSLDATAAAKVRDLKPGPHVVIAVKDDGCGMSAECILRIFEPFFTTKEIGKGTGLGLTTTQGIVKGHDGAITVESELGRGSTFRVYLPAQMATAASPVPATRASDGGQDAPRLLVVDDDDDVGGMVCCLLQASGYSTLRARSGTEALTLFQAQHATLALVLTDITMPDMDGFLLAQRLRALDPRVRVIAISGRAGCADYDEQGRALGLTLLTKPVRREILLNAITAALLLPQ